MELKKILAVLGTTNKSFLQMQADQQKKVAESANADDDTDNMTDDQLELALLTREIAFYHDTRKIRRTMIKSAVAKAKECAMGNDAMDFKLAHDRVVELCRFTGYVEYLARKLKMAYGYMSGTNDYDVAMQMLQSLESLAEYAEKALKWVDPIWQVYHPEPQKTYEMPTKTKAKEDEPPEEENEWDLDFER